MWRDKLQAAGTEGRNVCGMKGETASSEISLAIPEPQPPQGVWEERLEKLSVLVEAASH